MVLSGQLLVGQLTGFLSYVMQVLNSMMMLSNVFLLLTRSLASAGRIERVLEEKSALAEKPGALDEVPSSGVELRSICFKYVEDAPEYTLKDISLTIEEGQTIGILGGTGSGKTTLVQLMDRLYDTTSGQVLVGGHDVRDYSLHALREAGRPATWPVPENSSGAFQRDWIRIWAKEVSMSLADRNSGCASHVPCSSIRKS